MNKAMVPTKAEIERTIENEWREMIAATGVKWSPEDTRAMLEDQGLRPEDTVALGLTIGMSLGLGGMGKRLARKVKTRKQLESLVRQIREIREQMPTIVRKATKQMIRTLPRRGGPGRQPKLNPNEANQMCDQIATLIRHKHTLKQALVKASQLTPQLLGKKVSARTLQKAWDNRK